MGVLHASSIWVSRSCFGVTLILYIKTSFKSNDEYRHGDDPVVELKLAAYPLKVRDVAPETLCRRFARHSKSGSLDSVAIEEILELEQVVEGAADVPRLDLYGEVVFKAENRYRREMRGNRNFTGPALLGEFAAHVVADGVGGMRFNCDGRSVEDVGDPFVKLLFLPFDLSIPMGIPLDEVHSHSLGGGS